MNRVFEMHIRLGGDPRATPEYRALRTELAKLAHPACPDVDWFEVERLCIALLGRVGADLQTAATYTLARGHLYRLEGLLDGLGLIERLVEEWPQLWPRGTSVKVDVLGWLFAQFLPMLRVMALSGSELSRLRQLDTVLETIQQGLLLQGESSVTPLQAFRMQVGVLMGRLDRGGKQVALLPGLSVRDQLVPVLPFAIPWRILPPEPVAVGSRNSPRMVWALLPLMMFMFMLVAFLGWQTLRVREGQAEASWFADLTAQTPAPADPVQLAGLRLFEVGSAEFHAESSKALIGALVDIKARPGWLVMITGHSDATGNAQANRQLSLARAAAVRDWMQRMGGIPDSCLVIQGVAATQPVSSIDDAAGRAANRRIDIRLVPQDKACGRPEQA
jgi:type VI secretion system protein VasL